MKWASEVEEGHVPSGLTRNDSKIVAPRSSDSSPNHSDKISQSLLGSNLGAQGLHLTVTNLGRMAGLDSSHQPRSSTSYLS